MSLIKRIRHYKYMKELPFYVEEALPAQFVEAYRLEFDPHPQFMKLSGKTQLETYMQAINLNVCYLKDSYYHRYEYVHPHTINPADASTAYFYYRSCLPSTIHASKFKLPLQLDISTYFLEIDENSGYNLIEIPLSLLKIKEIGHDSNT